MAEAAMLRDDAVGRREGVRGNPMASWRERRAWRREFRSLGIRQTREREAHSIWHEEKLQEARRWLREQELRPYVIGALSAIIVGILTLISGWLK
jgi:CBS-domain-containing membrane protein